MMAATTQILFSTPEAAISYVEQSDDAWTSKEPILQALRNLRIKKGCPSWDTGASKVTWIVCVEWSPSYQSLQETYEATRHIGAGWAVTQALVIDEVCQFKARAA